jgi:hypothetical protein
MGVIIFMIDYAAKYDEDDVVIRKSQRNERIDHRKKAREDFMKVNSRGLKSDILPTLGKKAIAKKDKE